MRPRNYRPGKGPGKKSKLALKQGESYDKLSPAYRYIIDCRAAYMSLAAIEEGLTRTFPDEKLHYKSTTVNTVCKTHIKLIETMREDLIKDMPLFSPFGRLVALQRIFDDGMEGEKKINKLGDQVYVQNLEVARKAVESAKAWVDEAKKEEGMSDSDIAKQAIVEEMGKIKKLNPEKTEAKILEELSQQLPEYRELFDTLQNEYVN